MNDFEAREINRVIESRMGGTIKARNRRRYRARMAHFSHERKCPSCGDGPFKSWHGVRVHYGLTHADEVSRAFDPRIQ